MCFYEKFLELCKAKNVSPTKALVDAGLSKSLNSKWSKNPYTIPNGDTLSKLSSYFGCSIEQLVDSGDKVLLSVSEQEELFKLLNSACVAKNCTHGFAVIRSGIKSNIFSRLNSGSCSRPLSADLFALADYLDIKEEVRTFLDLVESKNNQPTADDDELIEYLEMLRARPECRALLKTIKGATKVEVEANVKFLEALRGYNND